MAKELPYFQFEPAQYLTGNIQFCSLEAQGLFINICAIYWQRECDLTLEQIKKKFNQNDLISELIKNDVIKTHNNGVIDIEFLDEQFDTITKSKSRLSEAGRKGALIKKQATLKPPLSQASTTLKQPDKIREDKIREDKIKEIRIEDIKLYFFENGYSDLAAQRFFDYYSVANWKDSKGNRVKNWKQKAQAVWFKPDNKIVDNSNPKMVY